MRVDQHPQRDRCPSALAGCTRYCCTGGDPRRVAAEKQHSSTDVRLSCVAFRESQRAPVLQGERRRSERSIAPPRDPEFSDDLGEVGEPILPARSSPVLPHNSSNIALA